MSQPHQIISSSISYLDYTEKLSFSPVYTIISCIFTEGSHYFSDIICFKNIIWKFFSRERMFWGVRQKEKKIVGGVGGDNLSRFAASNFHLKWRFYLSIPFKIDIVLSAIILQNNRIIDSRVPEKTPSLWKLNRDCVTSCNVYRTLYSKWNRIFRYTLAAPRIDICVCVRQRTGITGAPENRIGLTEYRCVSKGTSDKKKNFLTK